VYLIAQVSDHLAAELQHVDVAQGRHAELERERAEAVAAAFALLLGETAPDQAHEIAVRLVRRHPGGGGEVLQRLRAAQLAERAREAQAGLERIDSEAFSHIKCVLLIVILCAIPLCVIPSSCS